MIVSIVAVLVLSGLSSVFATEDDSANTGQPCSVCHVNESGGGGLTQSGESYSEDPDNWQPPEGGRKKTPLFFRFAHLAILYAHIFFGVVWVGTILYVHLVLKPQYAMGGLPRSELRLAWISIPVIAVTGVLLTVWRIRITPGLFSTVFGKLLLVKIAVFVLMVSSATFVTLYIGPRLKALAARHAHLADPSEKSRFTPEELRGYDGSQGTRALVAVEDSVYDVSRSMMWKDGLHAERHRAGRDLTEYLKNAPHAPDVLDRYEKVGELVVLPDSGPPTFRIFTVNAYFNLIGCFLIILILALWRW